MGQVGEPIKKVTIIPKENPVPSEPEPMKTPAPTPKPEKVPA